MTESLGTARLDIVVGTEQFDAAIQQAQTRISGMSATAQADFHKLGAAQKRAAEQALRYADTVNKTRQEQILYNAALRGVPTSILDELKVKLAASGNAAATASKQFNQYGVSARQQAAALRGVPAQLTDIFTSLASGQRPITVLLQQGGQLKDMFGGIVPAMRALGGAALGLINPFTLAAAAIVGVGLAWKTAAEEAQAFNLSIIQTGGFAGKSADDLQRLADELDNTTAATARFSADVVNQVNATGRFAGEQVDIVSTAITNMAKAVQTAGGDADATIKDLLKSFTDLSKDPVDALLKLNETQHFLTRSTLDQVQALVEQGRQAEASEVAIKALADTLNNRAPEMVRNVNSATAVFAGLKGAIAEAADEAVSFFRRADGAAQNFIRNHQTAVELFSKAQAFPLLPFAGTQSKITQSMLGNATKPVEPVMIGFKPRTVDSRAERGRIEAEKEFGRLVESNLSKQEKLEAEIANIRELGKKAGKDDLEIQKQINQARLRYKESLPKGRKPGSDGIESATSRAAIQALQDQLKQEQGLIQNQTRLLEANYAARNITAEKYYAEQKRLAQENNAAQVRALEGEIAALSSRSLKGKDAINNARELAQKEAELAKVRADGATALEVLNIQEAAQLKQRQQANLAYSDALEQGKEALKAELDSQVLRISVGEREFEIRSRIIQLYRDEAKELLNLARQRDAGEIDEDTYRQRADQLKKAIAEEVQIVKDGYDQMAAAQKDWANGALKAFADYRDAANDVAGQTYSLMSNTFSGLEDVVVDFVTKGKADIKGFFDGIFEEGTRMLVRMAQAKLFEKFMPGQKDGDSAQALSSAAGSLAASAAPLYGAAAALSASAAALTAAGAGQAAAGATGSSGDSTGGWMSLLTSFFANANGNAFDGGNVIPFATGGVVNRATPFAMAGGRMGVMGEAGPEAILPLHRGSDGKLGVRAETPQPSGGGVVVNQTIKVEGHMDRRAQLAVKQDTARGMRTATRRNGG